MMQRHLKTCVAVIGLLIAASMVHAGAQARIEGVVKDTAGNPIVGATIRITTDEIAGFEKIINLDKNGAFKTLILDATRNYIFTVEAEGYLTEERPFKVGVGSTENFFEFTLLTAAQAVAAGQVDLLQQPGYKELEEAKTLLRDGDRAEARVKFAEAVAAKPDLEAAWNGLAELTYEEGEMEEALSAAEKCLELDSESIQCLAIAANASLALGEDATHAEYMARYQVLNPEDPTILFNEAAAFLNKLDDENARPLLEKCLAADPEFPECNFEYGMLLLRGGDMEGAKTHLQKYLEIAPDGPQATIAQETIKYL
jgi:tetratricopeptide (TPR) repeat protein